MSRRFNKNNCQISSVSKDPNEIILCKLQEISPCSRITNLCVEISSYNKEILPDRYYINKYLLSLLTQDFNNNNLNESITCRERSNGDLIYTYACNDYALLDAKIKFCIPI